MGVYDSDIATAQELLKEFGRQCYWLKPPAMVELVPGYPTEGATPDPIPVTMAFFAPKDLDRGVSQFLDMMPRTEVPDGAQIGLLAGGLTFEPENTDKIALTLGGTVLSIERIDLLAPNGDPVLYFVSVTR